MDHPASSYNQPVLDLGDGDLALGPFDIMPDGYGAPIKEGGTVHYASRGSLKASWSANQAEALEMLADKACNLRSQPGKNVFGRGFFPGMQLVTEQLE
jgi:hypothetical protein